MTKPKDKELFKDNTTEELEQFYEEYRNTEEGKFPRCLDPYILSFRKKYNYQIDNKEALHIVANILLDEICDRKYSDNNYEYLVPSIMNRGLDKESGNMVYGAAFHIEEDDIRILSEPFMSEGQIVSAPLIEIRKNTLSYGIGRDDDNGKPVFTGDIVMYDYMENPYVIQMEYEPYRIIAFDPVTEDEQVVFVDTPLKIIGNIFQNPNLVNNP